MDDKPKKKVEVKEEEKPVETPEAVPTTQTPPVGDDGFSVTP